MAALGFPVASLFGCKKIPDDYPRHDCLSEART